MKANGAENTANRSTIQKSHEGPMPLPGERRLRGIFIRERTGTMKDRFAVLLDWML